MAALLDVYAACGRPAVLYARTLATEPVPSHEVDVENRPELFRCFPERGNAGLEAGVIYEDIEAPERCSGRMYDGLTVLGYGTSALTQTALWPADRTISAVSASRSVGGPRARHRHRPQPARRRTRRRGRMMLH
jgi:hypothetical protein